MKISSRVPGSTPIRAMFSAAMNGSKPITFMLKPAAALGDDAADVAEADDAEGFVAQLDADKFVAVPFAAFERGDGLGNMARQSHHQRDGMLAGGDVVAAGRIHDDDAAFGRGIGVDIFISRRRRGQ